MLRPPDPADVARRLTELRLEHRDLDAAIARMAEARDADQIALRRLKKRKLLLRDCIARLESQLIPDLDA
ncbi:YdcH family protein [Coralloluteibacterium thermophilus]|uniref:YdcH family protein n=1 Tax=Coralloluteibacterium thermophilum TaxID=2707049 RepID=A0ABV9NNJ3_9GAMM